MFQPLVNEQVIWNHISPTSYLSYFSTYLFTMIWLDGDPTCRCSNRKRRDWGEHFWLHCQGHWPSWRAQHIAEQPQGAGASAAYLHHRSALRWPPPKLKVIRFRDQLWMLPIFPCFIFRWRLRSQQRPVVLSLFCVALGCFLVSCECLVADSWDGRWHAHGFCHNIKSCWEPATRPALMNEYRVPELNVQTLGVKLWPVRWSFRTIHQHSPILCLQSFRIYMMIA